MKTKKIRFFLPILVFISSLSYGDISHGNHYNARERSRGGFQARPSDYKARERCRGGFQTRPSDYRARTMCRGGFQARPSDYRARVRNISNRQYFSTATEAIRNADDSIYMAMYSVVYRPLEKDSFVSLLLNDLIDARKRGVRVKVVLDARRQMEKETGQASYPAYRFLKDNGIDASYDTLNKCTHNKILVIDKKIVLAGSANWSDTAINENNETNVLILSPGLAEELISNIERISTSEKMPEEEKGYADIPYEFVNDKNIFRVMAGKEDERALDIYLILLRDGISRIGYLELAKELGLFYRMDRTGYRRQITKTLRKLAYSYGLLELETGFNKPFSVKLHGHTGDCFKFPKAYWEWGWDKRLMMREKVCFLINMAELKRKEGIMEWSMSGDNIAKKYGIDRWTVGEGMRGLRNYNILEIEHSFPMDNDYTKRKPNIYRYKGLYDMREFKRELTLLVKTHGEKKVTTARHYAGIVYRGYDISAVRDITRYMDIYGAETVDKAFRIAAMKLPDNPKRNFRYVIGTMKKIATAPHHL